MAARVQRQHRDVAPADPAALARRRPAAASGARVQERLHLVAQMVVARIVGGRDLARVRAGADDHRRLQPVAELERHLLDQRRASGTAGTTSAQLVSTHSREKLTLSR